MYVLSDKIIEKSVLHRTVILEKIAHFKIKIIYNTSRFAWYKSMILNNFVVRNFNQLDYELSKLYWDEEKSDEFNTNMLRYYLIVEGEYKDSLILKSDCKILVTKQ